MECSVELSTLQTLLHSTKRMILESNPADTIQVKGKANFVTQIDVQIEHYIHSKLERLYPGVQFLGEEEPLEAPIRPEYPLWILDPIDGTTNLICNMNQSCISLAFWDGTALRLGVVYNPFHDETFSAAIGEGAFLNGRPIHVSHHRKVSDGLMMFGTSPYEKERAEQVFCTGLRLFSHSLDVRRSGSAALDLCYLAAGRADGYFEYNAKPWDFAAAACIIQQAGGTVTTMDGRNFHPWVNQDLAASNGLIHRELLDILQSTRA